MSLTREYLGIGGEDKILTLLTESISGFDLLKDKEIEDLCRRIQENGDEKAFEKLINHNIRFVIAVAKKYRNQGVPFLDLIQAGLIGLINSAKLYKYNKDTKFTSYAVWGVKHNIHRLLESMSRTFAVTKGAVNRIQDLNKRVEEGEVLKGDEAIFYMNMQPASSLDAPMFNSNGDESNETLLDFISEEVNTGENNILRGEVSEILLEEIDRMLNDQEKEVIAAFFGLSGEEPQTLKDVGKKMGLSRERIRIVRDNALRKLKMSKLIRDCFGNFDIFTGEAS